ncbi:MAG: histone deacetylase family protein [Beijerinckiaceae bacterium]|nr:histone deacetylase family protein [Beijerinckiaceae bacterium]
MKLYFSNRQLSHQPQQYMVHGKLIHAFENNDRATTLLEALAGAGLMPIEPADHGIAPALAVHADHFIAFLQTAYDEFQKLPNAGPEVLPNIHAYVGATPALAPRGKPRPTGIIGRSGWYVGDLSAVIMQGTWDSALVSAHAAVSAADAVLAGDKAAFALCRPPGHHAYVDRASGFCFLNNAAIAAERLRQKYKRVAILDFDTHHGDGTQAIYYARNDVFFGSVHTDPSAYYPHYLGYADETGVDAGEGFNLNRPLLFGSNDADFIAANHDIINAALKCGAEALVISAGWDAHHKDPLSKLKVTTDAYARIGEIYGKLNLPTVIVQEGGYSLEAIAESARIFTQTFRSAKGV